MPRNNEVLQAPIYGKRARGFAHSALKRALDNPTPETYTAASTAVKRATGPKESRESGFSNTLRNIRGKVYDSWMTARDISMLPPTEYEYASTELNYDDGPKPEIHLGYIRGITEADRDLLGYLTSLHKGTSDMALFFSYVAAIGYRAHSLTYKARSERAAALNDPREREYLKKSERAADSEKAIVDAIESREEEDGHYTTEVGYVKDLFDALFDAEKYALYLDPRRNITTSPESIKDNEKLVLESEIDAQAATLLYGKLDAVRGQLQGHTRDTSEYPDPRLLTIGAKEEFDVRDVSPCGLGQTAYTGILQQGKNLLGYPLPIAPPLVVLTSETRERHARVPQDDYSFFLPPEEFEGIALSYEENIILSAPTQATREGVAQALSFAYVYNGNNKSLWGPEVLWEQEEKARQGLETELYDDQEIDLRLSQEVFTAGFAVWFGIKATSPETEAQDRIAHIQSDGQKTDIPRIHAEGSYLEEKLRAMNSARGLLIQAQNAQLDPSLGGDTAELFQQARTLKEDAIIPLGLYYVNSVMEMIDRVTSYIYDDASREDTKGNIIEHLLKNPPQTIEEFFRPDQTVKRLVTELQIELPKDAIKVFTKPEKKREEILNQEPSYPFKNLRRIVHWAERTPVTAVNSDEEIELHVPYYYHGTFSPVITPAVISEYAALAADRFSEGTADRVTQALFGMFEQMDSDVNLQRRGNEPLGYSRWHQAGLHFIRFRNLEEPLKIKYSGGISFADVASGLLTSAERMPMERPVFQRYEKLERPLQHDIFLNDWFFSDTPSLTKLGETVDVGITLQSIQEALATDALVGADGILHDTNDQEFLRSLVEFIPERPAIEVPQDQHIPSEKIITQGAAYVAAAANAEPEYIGSVYADLPPQTIMTEFEQSFPFTEAPPHIANLAGLGEIYGIPTPDGLDPIITPETLSVYSTSRRTASVTKGYEQAERALFHPFERIRRNQIGYRDKEYDEYPEAYRNWFEGIQRLGFVLFSNKSHGSISINYGFQLSHLIRAMSNTDDQLQSLNGFDPAARRFMNELLADLAYSLHEQEEEHEETKS